MTEPWLVLTFPDEVAAGERLAAVLKAEHAVIALRHFPDGESHLRLPDDLSGKRIAICCTLDRPDAKFAPLLFAADAARDLGALNVGLVAPYLAYLRQDKRFAPGEAVTSRTFAKVLSGAFDWLVTVDPHLHRYASLDEVYHIPTAVVHAAVRLGSWVRDHVSRPLLIGPDAESEQWVSEVARAADAPHVVLKKYRAGDRDVRIEFPDLSAFAGRQVVLVDDIVASGGTMLHAAGHLRGLGFVDPVCLVVHPLFADDAYAELGRSTSAIVSSDTVAHASNGISLAEDIAKAVATIGDK